MKRLHFAAAVAACALSVFAQSTTKQMDAPEYHFPGIVDIHDGTLYIPANLSSLYSLPSSCTAGQIQVTQNGVFICGASGWYQLASLTSGTVPLSQLPNVGAIPGTLVQGQFPSSLTLNIVGNASTATAFQTAPNGAPSGEYCTGIDASGNCIPASVQWSQIGAIPSLVLESQVGVSNGVASLDSGGKVPIGQLGNLGTAAFDSASAFVGTSVVGANGGVAELDSSGHLPTSELPASIPSGNLPAPTAATTSTLGAIIVGSNLSINGSGVLTVASGIFDAYGAAAAAQAAAIPLTAEGAANGVPTLDSTTHIPVGQIPQIPYSDLTGTPTLGSAAAQNTSYFLLASQLAQANGAASLDGSGLVPLAELPTIPFTQLSGVPSYVLSSLIGADNGVAELDSTGHVPGAEIPAATIASTSQLGEVQINGTYLTISGGGLLSVNTSAFDVAGAAAAAVAAIPVQSSSGSAPGLLSVSDYNAFAAKQGALGYTAENTANKGQPNGYAPLNSSGVVPNANLPAYQPLLGFTPENTANRGAMNGYAELDSSALVPLAEIPTIPYSQTSGFGTAATEAINYFVAASAVGANGGVAPLNSSGVIPSQYVPLPPIATNSTLGVIEAGSHLTVNGSGVLSVVASDFDLSGTAATLIAAIPTSGSSQTQPALITPTDWATFNGKEPALGYTPENVANKNVDNGYAGLDSAGKFPWTQLDGIPTASGSQAGILSSADWTTFNSKQGALGYTAENVANKGQANGYAGLDSSALVPLAQLPTIPYSQLSGVNTAATEPISYFLLSAALGQANGVASLNSSGQIPAGELSLPIASTTGTGVVEVGAHLTVTTGGLLAVNAADFDLAGTAAADVAAIPTASSSQTGLLSSSDWSTFNSKQAALGYTAENTANKGAANGYAGLNSSAVVPLAQLPTIPASQTSGLVASSLLGAANGVATLDSSTLVPIAQIPAIPYSHLSGAPSGLPPTGPAGGDLNGTYPNPQVVAINGTNIQALGTGALAVTGGVPRLAGTSDITTALGYTPLSSIPIATSSVLGGIKGGGSGYTIGSDGTLNVTGYTLPDATSSTLGGVICGSNTTCTAGTISVAAPFSLAAATSSVLGGVKIGANVTVQSDGTISVAAPYTLPVATASILGGVKCGTNLTCAGDGTISDAYSLPIASPTVLGGIKVGANLSIEVDGTLDAQNSYTLPDATTSALGGVIVGNGLNVSSGTVSVAYGAVANTAVQGSAIGAASGVAPLNSAGVVPTANLPTATTSALGISEAGTGLSASSGVFSLVPATSSSLGGVKCGSGTACAGDGTISVSARDYPVTLTSATSYTVTGSTHGLGTAALSVHCFDTSSPAHEFEPGAYTVNQSTFDVVFSLMSPISGGTCYITE